MDVIKLVWLIILGQIPLYILFSLFLELKIDWKYYIVPGFVTASANLLANVFFIISVRKAPLSHTIPMLSLTPVITAMIAFFTLHEIPSSKEKIAISLIVFGTFLLNGKQLIQLVKNKKLINKNETLGIILMICVALLWSLTGVFDKICLKHSSISAHMLTQGILILFGLTLWLFAQKKSLKIKTKDVPLKLYLATVIVSCFAIGLQFFSIQKIHLGIFESIKRSVGVAGSAVLGYIFFKENFTLSKILSLIVIIIGIYFFFI